MEELLKLALEIESAKAKLWRLQSMSPATCDLEFRIVGELIAKNLCQRCPKHKFKIVRPLTFDEVKDLAGTFDPGFGGAVWLTFEKADFHAIVDEAIEIAYIAQQAEEDAYGTH